MQNKNNRSRQEKRISVYDSTLMFPVLFLVGIGIVMVYSASSALALKKYGTEYYFLKKDIIYALTGMVILVICANFPYRYFRALAYPFLVLSAVLLITIQVSGFGYSAGGSLRWLHFAGVSMQPSEFARLALIIYLAYSLNKKKDKVKDFFIGFLPHIIVFGIFACLIIIQPDFGSVAILGVLTWIMLYVGGARILYLFSSLAIMLPAAYFILVSADYRIGRLLSFVNPWQYEADVGYQTVHSLMAFGTGGMWGAGVGKGYQKLFYLPEPHTDFIFSVIGEELGLLVVMVIIVLYAVILIKGIRIANNAQDLFGSFLAVGLTLAIGLQVCVNMGVALGLLPTKGLTLPFISYGGTSLILCMASVGILMNIGASSARKNLKKNVFRGVH